MTYCFPDFKVTFASIVSKLNPKLEKFLFPSMSLRRYIDWKLDPLVKKDGATLSSWASWKIFVPG